ncbi:hypothetical protein DFS34DRAFT_600619 [Phlyctochytrium arcticum]|nr:hypothetical protein DFS34DRAFT_600619 [Phlyctochytrium arcticum]
MPHSPSQSEGVGTIERSAILESDDHIYPDRRGDSTAAPSANPSFSDHNQALKSSAYELQRDYMSNKRRQQKPLMLRPGVDPASPLARVVAPAMHAYPTSQPSTYIIADALYVLCVYRCILILATHGLNQTGILHFCLIFAPLHSTYTLLLAQHDRDLARNDVLHTVYCGLRLAIIFAAAITAPGTFNVVDSTWLAFGVLMVIARGIHSVAHVVVAFFEPAISTRSWWLAARAGFLLIPCVVWTVGLSMDQRDIALRRKLWGAGVAVDQAVIILMGFWEAHYRRQWTNGPGGRLGQENAIIKREDASHRYRMGLLTALLIAAGTFGLFESTFGVGAPDAWTSIPLYPRSVLCGVAGFCLLYGIERLYYQGNPYLAPTTSHDGLAPRSTIIPQHCTSDLGLANGAAVTKIKRTIPVTYRTFLWDYLHIPLHGCLLVTIYALHLTLLDIYRQVREVPDVTYVPASYPPTISAALLAQNVSLAARQFLKMSTRMPYAVAVFTANPVTGNSSRLGSIAMWTAPQVLSVGMAVVILSFTMLSWLDRGCSSRHSGLAIVGKVILAAGLAIPAFLSAGSVITFAVVTGITILVAVVSDALSTRA